jgi:hypothetical protein
MRPTNPAILALVDLTVRAAHTIAPARQDEQTGA